MTERYGLPMGAPAFVQVALVDALTWDWQTADELAGQVWPWMKLSLSGWHPQRDKVRYVISCLRRRGIRIGSLKGFGYRLEEE